MGWPSRGCKTCRARRIKCDEARPACANCSRSKRTCVFATGEAEHVFVNENAFAQGALKRSCARKGKALERRYSPPIASPAGSISAALLTPLSTQATTLYVHAYLDGLDALPELARDHTAQVLRYWERAEEGSVLRDTVAAMALIHFARERLEPRALVSSCTYYASAIDKVREKLGYIGQEGKEGGEVLLLAVMLLCHFENLRFDKPKATHLRMSMDFQKSFWHHDGALLLLQYLSERETVAEDAHELFKGVRRQLIRTHVLRALAVPLWLRSGADFAETGLAEGFDKSLVDLALLSQKASTYLSPSASFSWPALQRLVSRSQEFDDKLAAWADSLPCAEWAYQTHASTPWIDANVFSKTVSTYSSVAHAAMWNRWRAARLIANNICVRACQRLLLFVPGEEATTARLTFARTKLNKLARDFCDSMPFCLGQIDTSGRWKGGQNMSSVVGRLLPWSLTVACGLIDQMPEAERGYLRGRLRVVGQAIGDGVIEAVADADAVGW